MRLTRLPQGRFQLPWLTRLPQGRILRPWYLIIRPQIPQQERLRPVPQRVRPVPQGLTQLLKGNVRLGTTKWRMMGGTFKVVHTFEIRLSWSYAFFQRPCVGAVCYSIVRFIVLG